MPEGDTIHTLARSMRRHLVGHTITGLTARTAGDCTALEGREVAWARAVGKYLLIGIGEDVTLLSHLGMDGSWHFYRDDAQWRRPRSSASIILQVEGGAFVCFDARTVELFESRAERLHPRLSRLGPDLIEDAIDADSLVPRIARFAGEHGTVAELLLDQRVAAGIGNVYKSEVLFLRGIHPANVPAAIEESAIVGCYRLAAELLRANVGSGPRVTTQLEGEATAEMAGRATQRDERLWVYGRGGRPCHRCGATVASELGGVIPRWTYWCVDCQPAEAR